MSLNKVMLIGNVGQDPEVRYLDNAQAKVARLRLATTERYTDRNGESRENTEWHTVTVWRRQAEVVEKYVRKGSQIFVEGKLQTREWTDQNGNKRTSTEVVADNIQLLGKRDSAPAGSQSYGQNASYNQGSTATTPAGPGGYQAPYQPNIPSAHPAAAPAPAPAPVQAAPVTDDFNVEGSDDLPF